MTTLEAGPYSITYYSRDNARPSSCDSNASRYQVEQAAKALTGAQRIEVSDTRGHTEVFRAAK